MGTKIVLPKWNFFGNISFENFVSATMFPPPPPRWVNRETLIRYMFQKQRFLVYPACAPGHTRLVDGLCNDRQKSCPVSSTFIARRGKFMICTMLQHLAFGWHLFQNMHLIRRLCNLIMHKFNPLAVKVIDITRPAVPRRFIVVLETDMNVWPY